MVYSDLEKGRVRKARNLPHVNQPGLLVVAVLLILARLVPSDLHLHLPLLEHLELLGRAEELVGVEELGVAPAEEANVNASIGGRLENGPEISTTWERIQQHLWNRPSTRAGMKMMRLLKLEA